jgi:dienelactone hydrolase
MTDIRDALSWAQKTLPSTISAQGVLVDPTRTVIIGWSTGGHLAMTTAWTAPAIGIQPPVAILSFYCPTDYKPSGIGPFHIYILT